MRPFGSKSDGKTLQLVQRGTDKRIPVELVKQPSGEVLDPAELEGLHVIVSSESGMGIATIPYSVEDGKLVVEVTADISRQLGLGVYTLTATGRIPDPAYADGYHDYEIVVDLCKVTKYGSNETPVKVLANVLEGLKGKDGKDAYQLYLETTTDNPKMTEAQYAAINATTTQYLYRINKGKDAPMNEQTLSADQLMELDRHRRNIIKALRDKGAQVSDDDGLEMLGAKIGALSIYVPIIFRSQQFIEWKETSFPTMQLSESYRPADLSYCFSRNPFLTKIPEVRGIENAANVSNLANNCSALTNVSLPVLPTVQSAESAFSGCSALATATVGSMPKVAAVNSLFQGDQSLTTATVGSMPKAANTNLMFYNCSSLKSVSLDLSGGEITSSEHMFSGCSKLTAVTGVIDLTRSQRTGNMFNNCASLEELHVKGLKVDLDLSACVSLSTASVKYLVDNLQQATGKSITLHRGWQTDHPAEAREYGQKAAAKGFTLNFR